MFVLMFGVVSISLASFLTLAIVGFVANVFRLSYANPATKPMLTNGSY